MLTYVLITVPESKKKALKKIRGHGWVAKSQDVIHESIVIAHHIGMPVALAKIVFDNPNNDEFSQILKAFEDITVLACELEVEE